MEQIINLNKNAMEKLKHKEIEEGEKILEKCEKLTDKFK